MACQSQIMKNMIQMLSMSRHISYILFNIIVMVTDTSTNLIL